MEIREDNKDKIKEEAEEEEIEPEEGEEAKIENILMIFFIKK